jgi:signal transduction histidine kinase/DNA-binding response OmpR family regulator
MLKRQFSIIVIIFLLTTTLIVVLQYNANKNINELVTGNENLLAEFKLRSRLQTLQNGLLSLDNNVRNSLIGKAGSIKNISEDVRSVRESVKELGELLVTDSSRNLWNQLKALSEEKIRLSYQVLDTLNYSGKEAAENIIKKQRTADLSEAIETVSSKLDISRQNDLAKILRQTDANSIQAKSLQAILAMVAVFILMFTLWYVVSRIRRQLAMISILNESEKKVREAAQVKEHFIANMSHEIRTPLNAILGFTKLLQKHPSEKNAGEYINAISASGENLLNIINYVLYMSKIEAGMMRVEHSELDTHSLFDSVYRMFEARAKEKGLDYHLEIEKDVPRFLVGDPVRITQIAVNLVSNAIKFTQKGYVTIHVSSIAREDKNLILVLKISDSGIGIPAEMKDQVFDRFTQADADTTRKYGGTGLGLSIVKQIVQLLNGTISVESTAAGGSEFVVSLPLQSTGRLIKPGSPSSNTFLNDINSSCKILVAEDNLMNQTLVRHLFDDWKINYTIASNGKEALSILENEKIDLILMDIQMPEMDGYTAAKKIREELKSGIPVIAMTAHAFAGEKEKCLSYGMNDYLSKPVSEEQLGKLLKQYLPGQMNKLKEPAKSGINPISLINLEYLNQLANGNKEFKKNILQQFLIQAPEETRQLENAFETRDFPAIKSRAHNLKTTISFLGLQQHILTDLEMLENLSTQAGISEEQRIALNKVLRICMDATKEAAILLPSYN